MTRDEIIEMGREAGVFTADGMCVTVSIEIAERFAALVETKAAAAEREACAKVCDRHAKAHEHAAESSPTEEWREISVNQSLGAEACADAIRARGEK